MLDVIDRQPPELFEPPRPKSLSTMPALLRAMFTQDGNLIELLPREVYRIMIGNLGYSRRSIVIINEADAVRSILTNPGNIYPKNDLMVGALAPLVGDSVFVSNGDQWQRQRNMIAPAFHHMKLSRAFKAMEQAVDHHQDILDLRVAEQKPFSLDLTMSHLTADVICRTVFSTPLASSTAKDVFESFSFFERSVAHVEIKRLILEPAWSEIPQQGDVLEACRRIREHLGALVDDHLKDNMRYDDIASEVIDARDEATGKPFDRKELIDQLGVFFLAGHETTASALTWAFYVLAIRPDIMARIRDEVDQITGGNKIGFSDIRSLDFTRSVFKECLRLYPPITFIPRVAAENTEILGKKIKKGAMVMIAPWVIHRHEAYWANPHSFDAERFMQHREKEIVPNSYMPFGLGPRVCVGANFATIEATLILARLASRYDFELEPSQVIKPVARLTTRPKNQIRTMVRHRKAAS